MSRLYRCTIILVVVENRRSYPSLKSIVCVDCQRETELLSTDDHQC